jgi:hypothetical protein
MLEIACHLRDVEYLFVERYGKMANHDLPALGMLDQDALAASLKYNGDDPATALRDFRALRLETVALLGALAHQSWQRVGVHPKRGEITIATQVESLHLPHDTNHLNQIRALKERFIRAPATRVPGE